MFEDLPYGAPNWTRPAKCERQLTSCTTVGSPSKALIWLESISGCSMISITCHAGRPRYCGHIIQGWHYIRATAGPACGGGGPRHVLKVQPGAIYSPVLTLSELHLRLWGHTSWKVEYNTYKRQRLKGKKLRHHQPRRTHDRKGCNSNNSQNTRVVSATYHTAVEGI